MTSVPPATGGGKWPDVSAAEPCPICGKSDRCRVAPDGALVMCRRVQSGRPAKGGEAWFHPHPDAPPHRGASGSHTRPDARPRPTPGLDAADFARQAAGFKAQLDAHPGRRRELAAALGLPADALAALPMLGWNGAPGSNCWTLPEVDAGGAVIGISRRFADGGKRQCPGGRRGLTLPAGWADRPGPVYVCEGASDALALSHADLACVGRFNNAGGVDLLAELFAGPAAGREVVVLGENDRKGSGDWPGRAGAHAVARKLAGALGRAVPVMMPPVGAKDARAWLTHPDRAGMPWPARGRGFATALVADAPGPLAARQVANLVCMADVEAVEVPWLWPGRIPLGRITLLVGRPGGGKSFLTLDIAARLSTGAAWPDGGLAPLGDTLFICAEDDPADTIAPRLDGAGADCCRVHLLTGATVTDSAGKDAVVAFDLGNVDLIRQCLGRMPNCKLVVVDPVGSYLGGGVDAHRDNEVRAVLAPLAALAAEKGVAVLLVCHNRKATAAFADDTALGSRGFVGLARSVLHLSADEADRDRRLLLPGKNNLAKSPAGLAYRIAGAPPRLEWDPDPLDDMHADDVQPGEGRRGPKPLTRDAAAAWLVDFLRGGPRLAADIEQAAEGEGLSWATVRRAQGQLGIVSRKVGFGGRWEWQLPPDSQGAQAADSRCPRGEQPEHVRDEGVGNAQESQGSAQGAQPGKGPEHLGDVSTFGGEPAAGPPRRFRSSDVPEEAR